MKVFISYSKEQLDIARKTKTFLDEARLYSFLASDDLRVASNWKDRIINELNDCEIIIPILSKKFKLSDWCSQELGIFYFQNKKIIPISVDKTISYGFIKNIQAKTIQLKYLDDLPLELLISEGLMECDSIGDAFICLLMRKEINYRIAERIFRAMLPYYERFKKEDINSIILASIENGQIWKAAECVDKHIPKLLKERNDDIDPVLKKKLQYQITHGKWYPK
ncbi:MAG: toll/interleukin-1 receptor domain-containing protein [Spirochaetaceae bacterium]|nr:toll/interleukin-1 receptor domain-containing protein [Spirochaetaceae bacterium]